eukprot:TRINITY_DN4410_c0_g1_i1.p1 TRINITY_DN4410_c0_g1~~TRINITY_DN4410_c0_g1_i1.p1  ORF type:complete len:261 (-),score=50.88 TRINITY_DN4410_c0_g1_i1:252-1034(-)
MIRADRLQVGRQLGEGEHGEVRLGRFADTLELAAVKVIDLEVGARMFKRELESFPRLSHPNLPKYYGHLIDQNNFGYVVMEYLPYPTLERALSEGGPMSETEALGVFSNIVSGISHMHSRGVSHRDVKSDNILYDRASKRAVLVDLGLSVTLSSALTTSGSYVGTPCNMAPELLCKRTYFPVKVDAWALGIVLLEMLLGHHPFVGATCERDLLQMQMQCWDFSCFSPLTQSILRGLLQPHSLQRWSVAQVIYALERAVVA